MIFQEGCVPSLSPCPSSTPRKVHAASQLQNLQDAPGRARNRRAIEAAGGCMLQTLRSLACEELAYTFRARLRRWELRTCC